METEKIIKTYNIGKDSRLVFGGDNKTYYVKSITPDRESVFVTIDGSTTFKKPLSKVTKVDGKMVEGMKSNKMTKEELKEMIRQNVLNELATDIKEDTNVQFGDPDGKLAPLYADFYEGLEEASEFDTDKPARIASFLKALDLLVYDEYHAELYDSDEVKQAYDLLVKAAKKLGNLNEAEEEIEDVERVDVNIEEPATTEPTLSDIEKEIQGHLNQALYAAQEIEDESTTEDKEKLIQQIGNTIKFFTSDFVVKEAYDELEENATTDIENKIKSGEIDAKEVEAAAKKAMSGDSKDLALLMAGFGKMFEGNKEYYKDAEADDAEHIKALEKDIKDDKKSSVNEDMFPLFKKIIK